MKSRKHLIYKIETGKRYMTVTSTILLLLNNPFTNPVPLYHVAWERGEKKPTFTKPPCAKHLLGYLTDHYRNPTR